MALLGVTAQLNANEHIRYSLMLIYLDLPLDPLGLEELGKAICHYIVVILDELLPLMHGVQTAFSIAASLAN